MVRHSQRVEAVKNFADENKDDEQWKVVLELTDDDIYNIVKQTQSPNGAIRKVARMIGSKKGIDLDLPAPTRTRSQAEAERKLLELAGTLHKEGEFAHPYDEPHRQSEPAAAIRPDEARSAVRGGGSGTGGTGPIPRVEEATKDSEKDAGKSTDVTTSSGGKGKSGGKDDKAA